MFAKNLIPKELVTLSEELLQQYPSYAEATEDRLTIPAGARKARRGSSVRSTVAALE